jgi:hypothetical protein
MAPVAPVVSNVARCRGHAVRRRSSHAGHGLTACLTRLLLLACCAMPQSAMALQATPVALPAVTCDVAPRSTTEILTLVHADSREAGLTHAVPTGDPADPATTAAITAVLGEMAACLTAGDMLRFYALHSDDWLRRRFGVVEGMAIQTMSVPTLDDGNYARYLGPWHVKILSDGRVLAAVLLVVGDDLRPDPDRATALLFVHHDGRWLIDETIASVRIPDCASPVAVAAVVGPPPGTLFDSWAAACD